MTLRTYPQLVQGTDEWLAQRCGIVTASVVGQLLTPTLKVANNDTSRGLTATLTAERITGHVEEHFVTADMWRGIQDEPIARALYAEHHAPVAELGFMVEDRWGFAIGYSPDGLVGDDGLIEIKSRRQKKHLQTILSGEVPPENMAQIQCALMVSGRAWCDYISYCGGMPLWTKRVAPDEAWFVAIVAAVEQFERTATAHIERYETLTHGLPPTERIETEIEI